MTRKSRTARKQVQQDEQWDAVNNPAVAELLDHVARQLAEEYVRIMKAKEEQGEGNQE